MFSNYARSTLTAMICLCTFFFRLRIVP